jgi:hypothetical protein
MKEMAFNPAKKRKDPVPLGRNVSHIDGKPSARAAANRLFIYISVNDARPLYIHPSTYSDCPTHTNLTMRDGKDLSRIRECHRPDTWRVGYHEEIYEDWHHVKPRGFTRYQI